MRHLWNETILPSVYFYITFIQKLICNKKVFRTKIVLLTHYLLTRSYLYQKDSILNLNWLRAWRNKGQSHYKLIKSFMCNESLSELRPSSVIERCYSVKKLVTTDCSKARRLSVLRLILNEVPTVRTYNNSIVYL